MSKKSIEKDIERQMLALYGENKTLTENPDPEHSVTCSNGTFVPKVEGTISAFRGIPFALPPIHERRWRAPEPVPDENEIREAFYNAKSPIQTRIPSERSSFYPQSEDCLYLNVWTNSACKDRNKPIMVFIHGGSYGWGGTVDPLYDGRNFIADHPDVVLITIAYRVGIFGFIDLSYLEGSDGYEDSTNLGLLDQIEALRWIQRNGAAFGGDTANVTIFGESAGGGSVSLLPLIKQADGLFRRVIAESGSVAFTFSREECKVFTTRLMEYAKTTSLDDLLSMSTEEIAKINVKLNDFNNFPMRDGRIVPFDPYAEYERGVTRKIDMLAGSNENEMNYWIGEVGGIFPYCIGSFYKFNHDSKSLAPVGRKRVKSFLKTVRRTYIWKLTEFYNDLMFRLPAIKQAEEHANSGGKSYLYFWREPSHIFLRRACHAVELAYVFRNIDDTVYTGKRADDELSKEVAQMWVNFAKTGDPSTQNHQWPAYNAITKLTMTFKANQVYVAGDIAAQRRELLYPLLPLMITPSYANLDGEAPFMAEVSYIIAAALSSLIVSIGGLFH